MEHTHTCTQTHTIIKTIDLHHTLETSDQSEMPSWRGKITGEITAEVVSANPHVYTSMLLGFISAT